MGGEGIVRLMCLFSLGNMITLYARRGDDGSQLWEDLYKMEIYNDLLLAYDERGKSAYDMHSDIKRGIKLRRLIGKAA